MRVSEGVRMEDEKIYRGDPNLKRPNTRVEWTKEQIAEYIKCRDNIEYFCQHYVKIINADSPDLVLFKPRDFQKKIFRTVKSKRETLILCGRQVGKSVSIAALVLHHVLFNDHKTAAILANRAETAKEILTQKVQVMYKALPKWLQQGVKEWNKMSIVLENGSRVIADATSANSVRGYVISLLVIDESAHIQNWDEFFKSVYPTISSSKNTKVVLITTPAGMNYWWKLWSDSEKGLNTFARVSADWRAVPGRDEEWVKQQKAVLGDHGFRQEHEIGFIGSQRTLISPEKLSALSYNIPVAVDEDGALRIYEQTIKGHIYVANCDSSRGKEQDYSVINMTDISVTPFKQVAVYRTNIKQPIEVAEVLFRLCRYYNMAYALCENNNEGIMVAETLYQEYEYENILQTTNAGRAGKRIAFNDAEAELGITTSRAVKSIGCRMIKDLIEQDQYLICDDETIKEATTFVKHRDSFAADDNCTDDIMMCLVLFGWLANDDFFKDLTNNNILNKLKQMNEQRIVDDLTPVGIITTSTDSEVLEEIKQKYTYGGSIMIENI